MQGYNKNCLVPSGAEIILSYLHILQTEGPPFCQPHSPPTIKEKIGYIDAKSIGSSFSRLELHAQAGSGQIATIFSFTC